MKGILKLFAGLVAFVVVVPLIAVGIFFATFDEAAFRTQATKQVSEALGREVIVGGPVGLDFKDGIALSLKQVSIGNPSGFSEKTFAKADTLFVSLNWQALLERKVDVRKVALNDAEINLITNASGRNNWDFPMGQQVTVSEEAKNGKPEANMIDEVKKAAQENRAPDFSINSIALANLEINNTKVSQVDQQKNKKQEFFAKKVQLKIPASGSFQMEGEGLVNGAPLEMKLETKTSLREVKEGATIPLELHVSYNKQVVDLKGQFSFRGKTYRFNELEAKLLGNLFTGTVQADMSGNVPMITGNISTPELNLSKMQTAKVSEETGKPLARPIAAASGPDLAVLKSFNSDLGFTTPKLVAGPTLSLENVNTQIRVSNGALMLDPLKMTYQGVPWTGLLAADSNANIRAALKATNVDYAALAQSFGSKSPVNSRGDITFDLNGRGLDAQAFMQTLAGKIEITSGPGDVELSGGNGFGGAIVKTLLPVSATEKPKLTCVALRLNADGGLMKINGFVLDSNYATVGGEGSINLQNQTADLTLKPIPKGTTQVTSLTSAVPVRVSGPLNQLNYSPSTDAVAQKAVAGLLSPGQKINTGVPQVNATASGNPCLIALNNPQPIMLDPPKTEQIFKDVRDSVKDNYKDIREVVKDPKKGLQQLLGGGQQQPPAAAPATAPSPQPAAAPAAAPTTPAPTPEAAPTAPAPAAAPEPTREEKAMDALKGLLK
jgi:uncharacterized protein involved in outer membrane biogenesis